MLAHRVIPILLARGHQLVKGKRFESWRSVGHVLQAAKVHQARGVDELVVLDIAATPAGRGPDFDFVDRLTADCFMPITVGGGVRSVADVKRLLACGADKVAICTALAEDGTHVMRQCSEAFGSQAVVAAIDYRSERRTGFDGPRPCVIVGCGRNSVTQELDDGEAPMHPVEWAQACERAGAGEILLTSIDRDGTMEGYDLELVRQVSDAVSIPVIANGGCSGPDDMVAAIKAGASAVAAGALFAFTDWTPRSCAEAMAKHGVEVRL